MGGGTWTTSTFTSYTTAVRGMDVALDGTITGSYSAQDMFKSRSLDAALSPKNVMRECVDTDEHPNTIPVILALDVTGSMGNAAVEVAKKLNVVMTNLFDKLTDVEFMIMGIGDLACDCCPIQISQFESDIRIAEQMDKIYFEFGGGGNQYESYTAAWYMGARHTKLDCWKRGKKGIIITMGDERLNPHLPREGYHSGLTVTTGDKLQGDIETKDLFVEASEKFDIYHLDVVHGHRYIDGIKGSFTRYLDEQHFREVTLDNIADAIVDIIVTASEAQDDKVITSTIVTGEGISW